MKSINPKEWLIVLVLGFIVVANILDMSDDIAHGAPTWHLYEEGLVVAVSSAALLTLMVSGWRQRRKLEQLKQELSSAEARLQQAPPEVTESRRQLGAVIQQQFADWQLTGSEREVGLLLLKGLS